MSNAVRDFTALEIPQSGLRPESLKYLRAGGQVHNNDVQIGVEPNRTYIIAGRHRISIAREDGELIEATIRRYGPRGGLRKIERVTAKV